MTCRDKRTLHLPPGHKTLLQYVEASHPLTQPCLLLVTLPPNLWIPLEWDSSEGLPFPNLPLLEGQPTQKRALILQETSCYSATMLQRTHLKLDYTFYSVDKGPTCDLQDVDIHSQYLKGVATNSIRTQGPSLYTRAISAASRGSYVTLFPWTLLQALHWTQVFYLRQRKAPWHTAWINPPGRTH